MGKSPAEARRRKRRRGDVAAAIASYMRENPRVDYFAMLDDLHAAGYRVNRHGNSELMALWKAAREEAGGSDRR